MDDTTSIPTPCAPPRNATNEARQAHTAIWFPERGQATTEAEAACRKCTLRDECLKGAVERREPVGIWGGAGGSRLRLLRREARVSEARYAEAAAAHFRMLDGVALPQDRVTLRTVTAEATHALRGSYAKGCRCPACSMASQVPDALMARLRKTRPTNDTAAHAA